jgi:hypothetical protein
VNELDGAVFREGFTERQPIAYEVLCELIEGEDSDDNNEKVRLRVVEAASCGPARWVSVSSKICLRAWIANRSNYATILASARRVATSVNRRVGTEADPA